MTAEAFPPAPERLHGAVIIEWPAPDTRNDWPAEMNASQVSVFDAGTGEPVMLAAGYEVIVRAGAGRAVTADLTLAGEPAVFRVRVAGMRVCED
jgi:hypothetical protein